MSVTVINNGDLITVSTETVDISITEQSDAVEINELGLTGPQGPKGDTGDTGPAGADGNNNLFIQNTEPIVSAGLDFLWVQTGLGDGTDFTVYLGKGL